MTNKVRLCYSVFNTVKCMIVYIVLCLFVLRHQVLRDNFFTPTSCRKCLDLALNDKESVSYDLFICSDYYVSHGFLPLPAASNLTRNVDRVVLEPDFNGLFHRPSPFSMALAGLVLLIFTLGIATYYLPFHIRQVANITYLTASLATNTWSRSSFSNMGTDDTSDSTVAEPASPPLSSSSASSSSASASTSVDMSGPALPSSPPMSPTAPLASAPRVAEYSFNVAGPSAPEAFFSGPSSRRRNSFRQSFAPSPYAVIESCIGLLCGYFMLLLCAHGFDSYPDASRGGCYLKGMSTSFNVLEWEVFAFVLIGATILFCARWHSMRFNLLLAVLVFALLMSFVYFIEATSVFVASNNTVPLLFALIAVWNVVEVQFLHLCVADFTCPGSRHPLPEL